MTQNPLVELFAFGQSFWLDYIRRDMLHDGTLAGMIREDGLRGMTSNPSIFRKAISDSDDYDAQLQELLEGNGRGDDPRFVFEQLAIQDIQAACDIFADLYARSDGGDGFVSLEVAPDLANDTEKTVEEARRLFRAVDRPNVMIKVPATPEGIPAIRQLTGEGVNVNITLMFNMDHYEAVAQAYLDGLADRLEAGGDPARIASVASFFVSRVDTAVDEQLDALNDPAADALKGKVAIANSKVVYQRFKEIFHGTAFDPFAKAGAARQRLLWGSTSTKNPDYSDVRYVEELIGPETVNTIPPRTIEAFRDHGKVDYTLEDDLEIAKLVLDNLAELGIDLHDVTEQLQVDGVASFADDYNALLQAIAEKVDAMRA